MEILKKKALLRYMVMFITAIALSVSLAACDDDDDDKGHGGGGGGYGDSNRHPLTGYWITYPDDGYGVLFNADGSGDWSEPFDDYKIQNGHLLILWNDSEDYDDSGAIEISGDTFRLYTEDGWITYHRQ